MATLIMVLLILWTIIVSVGTAILYLVFGLAPGGFNSLDWYDKTIPMILAILALVIPWGLYIYWR